MGSKTSLSRRQSVVSPAPNLDAFLARYKFAALGDVDEFGLGPLAMAALDDSALHITSILD